MKYWLSFQLADWTFFAILLGILAFFAASLGLLGLGDGPRGEERLITGEVVSLVPDPYYSDLRTRWTVVVRLEDGGTGITSLLPGMDNCAVGRRIQLRQFENRLLVASRNCVAPQGEDREDVR